MKKIILLSLLLILAVGLMATSSTTITVSGRIMNPVKNVNILYEPVPYGPVEIRVREDYFPPAIFRAYTDHDGYYSREVTINGSPCSNNVSITVTCLTNGFYKTVLWTGGDVVINLPSW